MIRVLQEFNSRLNGSSTRDRLLRIFLRIFRHRVSAADRDAHWLDENKENMNSAESLGAESSNVSASDTESNISMDVVSDSNDSDEDNHAQPIANIPIGVNVDLANLAADHVIVGEIEDRQSDEWMIELLLRLNRYPPWVRVRMLVRAIIDRAAEPWSDSEDEVDGENEDADVEDNDETDADSEDDNSD